jgi:hypothetical protein
MRIVLPGLIVVGVAASVLPAFWILVYLLTPFLNLYTWDIHGALGLSAWQYVLLQLARLLRASGIAFGAALGIAFAIRSVRHRRLHITLILMLSWVLAVACGVHLELTSSKVPPENYFVGFFEIPLLFSILVGVVAVRSSNLPLQRTGAPVGRPGR